MKISDQLRGPMTPPRGSIGPSLKMQPSGGASHVHSPYLHNPDTAKNFVFL